MCVHMCVRDRELIYFSLSSLSILSLPFSLSKKKEKDWKKQVVQRIHKREREREIDKMFWYSRVSVHQ